MTNQAIRFSTADDRGHGGLQILVGAGEARFVADEPEAVGGLDLGPSPHEIVAAGLAACTALTLRLYAGRKGWALGAVHVAVAHRKDPSQRPADRFARVITLPAGLDADQRARLLDIAEKCPIHRLLVAGAAVETSVAGEGGVRPAP